MNLNTGLVKYITWHRCVSTTQKTWCGNSSVHIRLVKDLYDPPAFSETLCPALPSTFPTLPTDRWNMHLPSMKPPSRSPGALQGWVVDVFFAKSLVVDWLVYSTRPPGKPNMASWTIQQFEWMCFLYSTWWFFIVMLASGCMLQKSMGSFFPGEEHKSWSERVCLVYTGWWHISLVYNRNGRECFNREINSGGRIIITCPESKIWTWIVWIYIIDLRIFIVHIQ